MLSKNEKRLKQVAGLFISLFGLFLNPLTAEARSSFDTLSFKPASDHGYYLTVEQSQTLGQWGYALGVTGDYSDSSLDDDNSADAISKQIALNLGMAVGLTSWLNLGVNVSGVPYQQFTTPVTLAQDNGARMGDVLLDSKIRLINNEISPIGLALVPFITFPTGSGTHFTGNGEITGGGKLVLDSVKIANRVSLAVNAGTQIRQSVTAGPGEATVGNQFLYGAGANIEVTKPVQLIAEVNGSTPFNNFFQSNNTDLETIGAVRFLPGAKRRVALTAGGGIGLQHIDSVAGSGAGLKNEASSPDWRVFTTLAYRFPTKKVSTPPPAMMPRPEVKEEVITTNKIHFAFNKSTIRTDSTSHLNDILEQIQGRRKVEGVRIEGHTDSTGPDEYNQQLSEERANAVRNFFVDQGYPADKVTAVGMGETSPIADNATPAGRGQNRRVEFHLQIKAGSNMRIEKKENSSSTLEEEAVSNEKNH